MAAHVCSPRVSRCPGCCRPRTLALLQRPVRGPVLFTPRILCRCGLVGGRTAFGEGPWLGLFFLFVSAPRGKRAALCHTRFHTPTPLPLYPDHHPPDPAAPLSPPLPIVLCLFSAGSDNESDEEVVGKKGFSAQVSGCLPRPGWAPWRRGQWCAQPGGQGLPSGG